LDKEALLKQFNDIENRVESLITRCNTLQNTNLELTAKVENLEEALRQKEAHEGQDSEVKALIRNKIDNLLERLDGITEAGT
jgi:Asp-tRNA(Asn)/Glu-tRNA(Gln) amidotransferase C subunit